MRNFSTQTYSCYSQAYGTGKPAAYVKQAKKLGQRALAITDRNTMAGLVQLEKEARAQGVKAIHGYDFYLFEDLSKTDSNKCLGRCIVYALDADGFRNLININNHACRPDALGGGFYYRPRMDVETLLSYSKGLALVISENGSDKLFEAFSKPRSALYGIATQLAGVFSGNFYLGISSVIPQLSYNMIPATEVRCIYTKDIPAASAMVDLDDGHSKINIINAKCCTSLEEIKDDVDPKLLDGLDKLFDSVNTNLIEIGVYKDIPIKDADPTGTLIKNVVNGWRTKLDPFLPADATIDTIYNTDYSGKYSYQLLRSNHPEAKKYDLNAYKARIKEEIDTFTLLNKHSYFYPIWQGLTYVDKHGKERGPGRGSGAGSLYCNLLNLTLVDPMPKDLLFERFINVARINDPPDLDTDLSRRGRDLLLDFMKNEYGHDHVTKIGTYSRLKIKSAIKTVARAKGYGIHDNDGKLVQYEPHVLDRILDIHVTATSRGQDELDEMLMEEKFALFHEKHSNWFNTYVMPILEGVTSTSIHAAGIVITPEPFQSILPLNFRNDEEGVTTQWEMNDLDAAGYLKYDMLVIDAVDVIQDAKDLIKERHGYTIPPIEEISIQDEKTLAAFNKVTTRGIFQFNTFSQMRYLKQMKPKSFDNMVASVALIRPGPIMAGAHKSYAMRMNGEEAIEYAFDEIADILEPTYGLMVYQEQMMQIAKRLADFTGPEAEGLRKACGKKKIEEMKKWEVEFIERSVAKGFNRQKIEKLWSEIVGFAQYSFNLSHSVAYTYVSYYQMWIKVRFLTEYWCATLLHAKKQNKTGNSVYDLKAEAEREGIRFNFPSVNGFAETFTVASENVIYWPLNVIKGCGEKAIDVLTDYGNRYHFESMEHFVDVCLTKHKDSNRVTVNAGVVKALVKAGFFNDWMEPWEAMKEFNRIKAAKTSKKEEVIEYEMARDDKFYWQLLRNEIFGCQVESWKKTSPFSIGVKAYDEDQLAEVPDGKMIMIGGQVKDVIQKRDKNGNPWAQLKITDGHEVYWVKAWNSFWGNIELDKTRSRPRSGDLIELVVKKGTFNGRADLAIGDRGQCCRIVARQ